MSRARGPHSAKQTRPEVRSLSSTLAVVRQVPAQPGQVVLPERGPGDEQVAVGRDPGDGHVALDPAAPVEQLRVDDPPDRHVDVVGAHRLEERDRARPDDLDLGERRLVEQAGRPPRRQRLGADRRRPVLAGPAARSERLVAGGGVRLEPVRALPAGLLAERRAEALEDRVGRRHPERPAGLALLVRVVDVVVGRVVLDRARQRVAPGFDRPARTAGCPSSRGRARARRRRSSDATWRPIPPAPGDPVRARTRRPRRTRGPRTRRG